MLDGLFSLTQNMIAWHGIFQMLDRVSFCSRRPLFTNETRRDKEDMRAQRGASYRFFSYFLYCWCSPKTPFKISFPDQEDFQSLTFWNARDDFKIIFHPHVSRCVAYVLVDQK
ncbi:hypothetical protein T01_11674 [Trichinella spiralis]|uniref:Uncharacterized protein n=1 Tax=Trichinella spiralis TaxID=6334 RepID=A0A0V0YZK9_TRISP|nr:hypothetical protein T01_11674 [Trichinella spiralis]